MSVCLSDKFQFKSKRNAYSSMPYRCHFFGCKSPYQMVSSYMLNTKMTFISTQFYKIQIIDLIEIIAQIFMKRSCSDSFLGHLQL